MTKMQNCVSKREEMLLLPVAATEGVCAGLSADRAMIDAQVAGPSFCETAQCHSINANCVSGIRGTMAGLASRQHIY